MSGTRLEPDEHTDAVALGRGNERSWSSGCLGWGGTCFTRVIIG